MGQEQFRRQADGWLGNDLRARFAPVAVIFAPPRSGSTALARSLWQHPMFRYYLHEPFDRLYYNGSRLSPEAVREAVLDRGADPDASDQATGIVVKEMAFQAGDAAPGLLSATSLPVILLIRDPRLSVSSRMRKLESEHRQPAFPPREAGWRDLGSVHRMLLRHESDYVVMDISAIRRFPARGLSALCRRLGLPWDEALLSWPSATGLRLGQLEDRQARWYERVLSSTGFEPPDEPVPGPDYFRARGMDDVVAECLALYEEIRADPRFLDVAEPVPVPEPTRWRA